MSVVGAGLGGAGMREFRLLPFLFLFGFVHLGLDLGLVVVYDLRNSVLIIQACPMIVKHLL